MIVRVANENDFDRIHELMYQIFEKHLLRRPDIYKQGEIYTLEQHKKSLINKNELILLAESDQMVVGLFHMVKMEFKENPFMRQDYVAFIEDFCVDRDYQRHGIGKVLYEEVVKTAEAWQADSLELNVWEINEEARKFYDAIGFKAKSTRMEFKLNTNLKKC